MTRKARNAIGAAALQPAVRAALEEGVRSVGGAEAQIASAVEVELTNREGRRVARYDVEIAEGAGSARDWREMPRRMQWVGKLYDNDDVARRVAAVLEALAATDFAGRSGAVVPHLVHYAPAGRVLLMTFEQGLPVVERLEDEWTSIVPQVGCALAALHETTVGEDLREWHTTSQDLLTDLRRRQQTLAAWLPSQAEVLHALFDCLENSQPPAVIPHALTHGDFGAGQLLWREGCLVVLDFDKCAHGDPALDLGNFTAQLQRRVLLDGLRAPVSLMRDALLTAYLLHTTHTHDRAALEERVAWHERVVLLRRVHFFMRQGTPDRHKQALALLDWLLAQGRC